MSKWNRPDLLVSPSSQLRREALAARERQRAMRKHGPGPGGHRHRVTEEHYHIVYHVPRENISIPYFKDVFPTAHEGYARIAYLGNQAGSTTEWYDEGEVGFETRIPGRIGLYWVVVELMGCIRRSCSQFMTKEMRKRQFVFVPDDGDPVPLEVNPDAVRALGPGTVTDERDL